VADLARVFGQPVPVLAAPATPPGPDYGTENDPPVRHHGVPSVEIDPLLRMAVLYPVDHAVHKAMTYYAQVIQSNPHAADCPDPRLLEDHFEKKLLTPKQLVVAAEPIPAPNVHPDELPEVTRVIDWREVLHRDDWLAERCVNTLHA